MQGKLGAGKAQQARSTRLGDRCVRAALGGRRQRDTSRTESVRGELSHPAQCRLPEGVAFPRQTLHHPAAGPVAMQRGAVGLGSGLPGEVVPQASHATHSAGGEAHVCFPRLQVFRDMLLKEGRQVVDFSLPCARGGRAVPRGAMRGPANDVAHLQIFDAVPQALHLQLLALARLAGMHTIPGSRLALAVVIGGLRGSWRRRRCA